MLSASLTYILHCKSCGVHGETDEFMDTFICPKCQGEMKLSEVRLSGDDSSIDLFLKQMIDSAELGDVMAKRTLAFLADSPNEHTRTAVGNAMYRKIYPEHKIIPKQNSKSISNQSHNNTCSSSSQTGISERRVPEQKIVSKRRVPEQKILSRRIPSRIINQNAFNNADDVPPHHAQSRSTSSLGQINKGDTMKNTIPIELITEYKIRGNITAVFKQDNSERFVAILADIHCPEWDFNDINKEQFVRAKISIYDEDNDICASQAVPLWFFWKDGAKFKIPEDVTPAKVVVSLSRNYKLYGDFN